MDVTRRKYTISARRENSEFNGNMRVVSEPH
jgi:hypothetical protein